MSTPTLIDARVHATAIKAELTGTVDTLRVLDYDEVPGMNGKAGKLPNIYVALSVERRGGAPLRSSATTGRTGWRVAVRGVGRTVDECRWAMFYVATALNEKVLTIGDEPTTPVQFESDLAPEWDDGRYSALALYTYVH